MCRCAIDPKSRFLPNEPSLSPGYFLPVSLFLECALHFIPEAAFYVDQPPNLSIAVNPFSFHHRATGIEAPDPLFSGALDEPIP
jgi:hypothetical protein